jgi:hypothetical protein
MSEASRLRATMTVLFAMHGRAPTPSETVLLFRRIYKHSLA